MNGVRQEVRNDFSLYEGLLFGLKETQGDDIYVYEPRSSRPDWMVSKRAVEQLAQPSYRSEMYTEVKAKEHPRFKFLLFAPAFMSTPLAN